MKSVTLSFLKNDGGVDKRRALLTVQGPHGERVFVPFPSIPGVLLAPPRSHRFAESHAALEALVIAMLDRVNLLTPAALLLDRREP